MDSPRPWVLDFGREGDRYGDVIFYCRGILDANGDWVVRFDDDYGTDQWANAQLIVDAVNGYNKGSISGSTGS